MFYSSNSKKHFFIIKTGQYTRNATWCTSLLNGVGINLRRRCRMRLFLSPNSELLIRESYRFDFGDDDDQSKV